MWGFIRIQIVCKGHQQSSKFTASGLRDKLEEKCSRIVDETVERKIEYKIEVYV